MKKFLLSITLALMGIASGFAAKAHSALTTSTQSDGSQLTIRLHGDEHFSWYSTADDVLLVQVGSNYYVAQVEEDGTLKATPQLAHHRGWSSSCKRRKQLLYCRNHHIRHIESNKFYCP